LYRRAFIKVVEEISEPLVRQELQLSNVPQFVELITKKIRNEGRNVTAHSVTDADHLRELFDVAKTSLEDPLTKLFTHYYPKVRKHLCVQIEKKASLSYDNLLESWKAGISQDPETRSLASFRTFDSGATGKQDIKGKDSILRKFMTFGIKGMTFRELAKYYRHRLLAN